MNTYIIPAIDSAVGNGNTAHARLDGTFQEVSPCAFVRRDYVSSRYDSFTPGGTGAFGGWTYTALAFRQDDLSFLDTKKFYSATLWFYVIGAAPALHSLSASSPLKARFFPGDVSGACAYNGSGGSETMPLTNADSTLLGWRSFSISSLSALKNIALRGARLEDAGHTYGKVAYFYGHGHQSQTHAPYIEVKYQDENTKPLCEALSPSATVVDADFPVTFNWSYQQAVNTPQTHATLHVRNPGGPWHTVADKIATSEPTFTAQNGLPLRGDCQWHVQVFCSGGTVASDFSPVKSFLCAGSPAAPAITSAKGEPRCTVTWQQQAQTGFELFAEDENGLVWHSGQRLSAEKSVTLPLLLPDGTYTLRLRTLNAQGRWGPFATAQTAVKNIPAGRIFAQCQKNPRGLGIQWTAQGTFDGFEILQDDAVIARLPADACSFTHRMALGACRYVVRGIAGRHYTLSDPCAGNFSVDFAVIGQEGDGDFIPLEVRYDAPPLHRQNRSADARFLQYEGGNLAVGYVAAGQQCTHTLYFTLENRAHYQALLSLVGQRVIYKDRQGDAFCGILAGVCTDSGGGYDAVLSITEAGEDEYHDA